MRRAGVTAGCVAAVRATFWLLATAVAGLPNLSQAAPLPLRIAVAPFETVTADDAGSGNAGAAAPDLAKLLAGRLARHDVERLITPDAMVAEAVFEPRAESVRRWAHNVAVDAVVVGRVTALARTKGALPRRVEVIVRSGHSGAELHRHSFEFDEVAAGRVGLATVLDPLAIEILRDFGHEPVPVDEQRAAPVAALSPPAADASGASSETGRGGRGLDTRLDLPGFESRAPIEIKADEAEIISKGEDRQLIFQRNVRVRQANVYLRSDHLEADYRKGESDPRRLVARGRVKIDQGDRKASCDTAIYLREEQQLTCRGHAELVQGCDVVRGESIEFDLAGDQARVQGAASIVIRPESQSAESGAGAGAVPDADRCAGTRGLM